MKPYAMRCKHCGGLLEDTGGALQRLFHASSALVCGHCNRTTSRTDAEAMGACFAIWVETLEGRIMSRAKMLPVLTPGAAAAALGVSEDDFRHMPGVDTLCAYVLHMFRPVILEQAYGRDVEIVVIGVGAHPTSDPTTGNGGEAAVGVFGMVEDDKGVREWEATIARVGPARFVVHATAGGGPVGESSPRTGRELTRAARTSAPAGESTPEVSAGAAG